MLIFYTFNFAILGAPKKMINEQWKSVKVSIRLGFLPKLIERCNLVNVDHKHYLRLKIFEYRVYQNSNTKCKQTQSSMDISAIIEIHRWGFLGSSSILTQKNILRRSDLIHVYNHEQIEYLLGHTFSHEINQVLQDL